MKWTRKGEIERVVDDWRAWLMETHDAGMLGGEDVWLRTALARFARKVLKEHYRKDIAASTETLTLRERVRTLEGRIGVMAPHAAGCDCPPGTCGLECGDLDCEVCWREWGLG